MPPRPVLEHRKTDAEDDGGHAAALAVKVTLEHQTAEVSRTAAEQMKRKYRIGSGDAVEAEGVTLPGARILGLIRPVLERLATEVVRTLQFYAQSHGLAKVERLLLCGGGAALAGTAVGARIHVPFIFVGV